MKAAWVLKFLYAVACGTLFGLFIHADYEKWNKLGRESFLAYQAHRFDTYMAHPNSGAGLTIALIIFTVGLFALYEGLAFAAERLFASKRRASV